MTISAWQWDYWQEQREAAPDVTIFRDGDPVTVRKPRRLSCGGDAKKGWRIRQTVGIEDGEFFVYEVCQICDYEAHGYERDPHAASPEWPRHGNVPQP
jgi:hypothetical protein